MSIEQITRFDGEYRFLSNFYPASVLFEGFMYPTSEHAYQAAKTQNLDGRRSIMWASSPSQAKLMGQSMVLRPMWDDLKVGFMYQILCDKFYRNVDIRKKLLETDGVFLEEGNTWGDTFWGVCRGEGQNYLGRLLMVVRDDVKHFRI